MTTDELIFNEYSKIVKEKYPQLSASWPIVSGYNIRGGFYGDYSIGIFEHTGNLMMVTGGFAQFDQYNTGVACINPSNIDAVREKICSSFRLSDKDYSVVIIKKDGTNLNSELLKLLERHEYVMGVKKMKIFLSHKTVNKPFVRKYKEFLDTLGFDVWLDDDAMPAGTTVHRGIFQGFKDACAVVFFVTPDYVDKNFLEMEIDLAIEEKINKGDKFAIITLVFEDNGKKGEVPGVLKRYVWKEPKNDLEAIQEIVRALPIKLGEPRYR